MATSQNGWPVVGQGAVTDRAILGVEFPNGWLKGDVDVVFTHLIGRLHREVEPLDDGGCWGWFVKNIEGSTSISNHASGTAIDYNAPAHPMGVRNTYSAGARAKIHAILADLDGVVRWGGDYTGRPDDMHFEIDKGAAAVRAVADKIRGEGGDMLVKKGDSGEQVKFWQYVLNDLGFAVEVDGDYGGKTEAAINAFRKANGVTTTTTQITGWTGWSMLRALAAEHAGKPGTNGKDGAPGAPGKDAVLSGTLTVTGGQLTVEAGA
jgi:hypothetical protein